MILIHGTLAEINGTVPTDKQQVMGTCTFYV